jgi:hypothetical protein
MIQGIIWPAPARVALGLATRAPCPAVCTAARYSAARASKVCRKVRIPANEVLAREKYFGPPRCAEKCRFRRPLRPLFRCAGCAGLRQMSTFLRL